MDAEDFVQNTEEIHMDSVDNTENSMENIVLATPVDTEPSPTVFVLNEEQYQGLVEAATLVYQNNHVDAIMLQSEIAQDTFGASFLLCGCLCALILFRGLIK